MRIDHVVLGSRDLDASAERLLKDHGLASVPGGRHPAWGTGNGIVPLGHDYVELLAVVNPGEARRSAFGRFMTELTADGDRWFTLCIGDGDLEGTADRLGLEVVRFLSTHPRVTGVHYPGLGEHPDHDVAARQMSDFGGMVSFEVGSAAEALDVVQRTKLFFLAESLGGVESLIEVPGPMTHASVAGSPLEVPPNLIRLSVGIEHPVDLVADLEQALG